MIDWLFNSWKATRKALMVEQVLVAKYVLVAGHHLVVRKSLSK